VPSSAELTSLVAASKAPSSAADQARTATSHARSETTPGSLATKRNAPKSRGAQAARKQLHEARVTQHRPLSALDDLPRRLDTRLVFPAEGGGHLDLDNWSRREWKPAIEAAGIEKRGIYELRHTGITNWFAAGLSVFEVSRYAGTSRR
jgi:integrase